MALMTETPLKSGLAGHVPFAHRLISGLAQAVVIVGANDRSGALITARHAAEQGRDVFTLPANVDSAHSAGSLKLLRGGQSSCNVDDLLEDLKGLRTTMTPPTSPNAKTSAATPIPAPPPVLDLLNSSVELPDRAATCRRDHAHAGPVRG